MSQTQTTQTTQPTHAPRLSLTRERLHFVSYPVGGSPRSLRLRLTGGLVGKR